MADAGSVRFSRDVMWTMAARATIAASSVLTGVVVARWLGAGAVGILASLSVITMLAVTVGSFGLSSAITFLVAREPHDARHFLQNAVVFGLISGAVLAAVLFVAAVYLPELFGDVPPTLVVVVAATVPVQMITAFCLAVYLGLERIRTYNIIDLTLQGAILWNAVVTLIIISAGLYPFVVVSAIANVLIGTAVLGLLSREMPHGGRREASAVSMGQMLRTGSRFFVAIAAGLIVLRGDLLLVNHFRGSEETGVYAVATQMATFLQMMPNVISTVLFPRTAGAEESSAAITSRVTRHAAIVMGVLCLAAIPLAFILPLLYGPVFANVPMVLLILLPGVFVLGLETVQVQYFAGKGLPRIVPAFWIAVMGLNLGLNVLAIPRYGAFGAAFISTVSYVVIFALVAIYFRKKTGIGLKEAFLPSYAEAAATVSMIRRALSGPNEGRL